jgi:hypothetical protein
LGDTFDVEEEKSIEEVDNCVSFPGVVLERRHFGYRY